MSTETFGAADNVSFRAPSDQPMIGRRRAAILEGSERALAIANSVGLLVLVLVGALPYLVGSLLRHR